MNDNEEMENLHENHENVRSTFRGPTVTNMILKEFKMTIKPVR